MRELHDILARINDLDLTETTAALATVVSTSGSTYRRPGARMLITADENLGAVSPGCLEDEVIATAHAVIESATPQLMQFDTTEEMDAIAGSGLGCRGIIEVFIEPLHSAELYSQLSEMLAVDEIAILGIVVESQNKNFPIGTKWIFTDHEIVTQEEFWVEDLKALDSHKTSFEKSYLLADGNVRVYAERVRPLPKLLVFGGGFDALPVVKLASQLGFATTVVDHREQYLSEERFPSAHELVSLHPSDREAFKQLRPHDYIVVMTHNYLFDLEILKYSFGTGASFIGQIGPKDRAEELLEELRESGISFDDEMLSRFHSPIGLDLGAETPEEIALSIMSEILAVHRGRAGQPMRDCTGPIHGD